MTKPRTFRWITKDMKAKVDLSDKDALYKILDRRHVSWNTIPQGEPAPGFDPADGEYQDLMDERD